MRCSGPVYLGVILPPFSNTETSEVLFLSTMGRVACLSLLYQNVVFTVSYEMNCVYSPKLRALGLGPRIFAPTIVIPVHACVPPSLRNDPPEPHKLQG